MSIVFLTEPGGYRMGAPVRARACRCPVPFVDHDRDSCVGCGHWLEETIRQTWAEQARRLEAGLSIRAGRPRVQAARRLELVA